ncbi:type VII secretion protein EccB [[Mycobacterium] holstebronense]|uniref:Type VII secretion protein EccB n=1 Tax=[Mycobacterium] holstebronense TaxID=3064288 RepID=A0ABM9M1F3_9MYCO|nr:type VII secretion protein EccB [Mycolicibacter sp. MU0102]CAJ1508511.1 type VII secretion protein EccB [Mycolicibacter sp. MU0102]
MAGRSTTQLQLSAHRFLSRRMERALRCGQVRGGPVPGGSALALGSLLSLVVAVGAVMLAVLRPQPALGDAPIVLDRATGALYVRIGETVHPVYNLASARLITGAADPRPVDGNAVGRARRGPPLGIPGAPGVLGVPLPDAVTWSLCEDSAGTVLMVGADPLQSGSLDPQQALPVSSESGAAFLVIDGRRVAVDPADPLLDSAVPRRVSALLLNAIPEAPPAGPRRVGFKVGLAPATLCVHWRADDAAGVTLSSGVPLPVGESPTVLAQADGPGPALDGVYLPPGHSAYVRAADTAGHAGGVGYLIAESGVRFTLDDDDAARRLGLPAVAAGVPWPLLAGLPAGPRLSRDQALLGRDVVPGPIVPDR